MKPVCLFRANKRRDQSGEVGSRRNPPRDMDLTLPLFLAAPSMPRNGIGASRFKIPNASRTYVGLPYYFTSSETGRKKRLVSSALPETAASVVVAAIAVGAAATLLTRTTKAPDTLKSSLKICEDCGGSGICAECKGEGFILKQLSDESVEKARMAAKNMATRFTAGLPKKWSYCSKCSSSRSCSTCGGSGRISW